MMMKRSTASKKWMYVLAGILVIIAGVGAALYVYKTAIHGRGGFAIGPQARTASKFEVWELRRKIRDWVDKYGKYGSENVTVTASRIFAGPKQYSPGEFARYGILAFRSPSTPYDRDRHLMICNAYVVILPHVSELEASSSKQNVTVWPLNSDEQYSRISQSFDVSNYCQMAVDNYGIAIAQQALKDAEFAGVDTSGVGPLLLAWAPSIDKGKQDALVLAIDLSNVTTYEQAHRIFLAWSRDIERDPTLWSKGWNIERLRRTIQQRVDKYGSKYLGSASD